MTQIPAKVDDFRRLINAGLEDQGYTAAWRPAGSERAARPTDTAAAMLGALERQERALQSGALAMEELPAQLRRMDEVRELVTDPDRLSHRVLEAPSWKHCHHCNPPLENRAPHRVLGPRDCSKTPELPPPTEQVPRPVRRRMYQLRDALRTISRPTAEKDGRPVSRIGSCGYGTTATGKVAIVVGPEGRGRLAGVCRCGSVWECPVCSLHIRACRAEEVRHVVNAHGAERCVMLTVTLRHGQGDDLRAMRSRLADAWRGMIRGSAWARFTSSAGVVGSIRALEVTHGRNGWHPHLHVVLLLNEAPAAAELLEVDGHTEWVPSFRGWIVDRWLDMARRYVDVAISCDCGADHTDSELARTDHRCRCGADLSAADESPKRGQAVPDANHGVSLTALATPDESRARKRPADYLCKLGLELTHPDKRAKNKGRSPLQIADDWARFRRQRDKQLWMAYCTAMLGARQLTWSTRLRDRFGLRDRTDLELSVEEEATTEDRIVATVELEDWRVIRANRGWSILLLELAELEGRAGVEKVIQQARGHPLARGSPEKGSDHGQLERDGTDRRSTTAQGQDGPQVQGRHL